MVLPEQGFDQVGADEAGCAGDEYFHFRGQVLLIVVIGGVG
jgi:hypothetical protein